MGGSKLCWQVGDWLEPCSCLSLKHFLPPIHARLVLNVFTPVANITQIFILGGGKINDETTQRAEPILSIITDISIF